VRISLEGREKVEKREAIVLRSSRRNITSKLPLRYFSSLRLRASSSLGGDEYSREFGSIFELILGVVIFEVVSPKREGCRSRGRTGR